jgi:acyl-coenzyme A synthetase/AMP-(fatty) acid ligase
MTEDTANASLPRQFNMAAYCIGRAAAACPKKEALLVIADAEAPQPAETWTYEEIEDAVLRTAAALIDVGIAPGSRLLIRLDNTSAYAILFFGCIAAGIVPMPTSALLTEREVHFLLKDSGAAALAVADHLALKETPTHVRVFNVRQVSAMMKHPRRGDYALTAADDPAFLIYTSGTTAEPKGVLHAHRSAWGRRPMYDGWYGIGPEDRMLHAGAFNWTFTLGTGLADPWANAATSVIYTGEKSPAIWPRLIVNVEATIFAAVPALVRQILKYAPPRPGSLGPLRHALIAGETPPPGLFEQWTRLTGLPLYEALGMSEISTFISSGPLCPRKDGTIGRPQPGRRIAILPMESGTTPLPHNTEGLLAVHRSDPGLMIGYWNRPEEEASVFRGDWFVGGDIASIDEEGYVTHHGRANDLMNALGYRVSPLEVEAALAQHPGVTEVACAELRIREDLSIIAAFVVPKEGQPVTGEMIMNFAAERLASYKCPREVCLVDALPRTANGKVQRSRLPSLYSSIEAV